MLVDGVFLASDEDLIIIETIIINDEDLMELVIFALDGENEDWAMLQLHERISEHNDTFQMHSDELTDGLCKVMDKLHM